MPHPVTTADKMHGVWKFGSSHGKARASRFGRGITVNSTNAVYFLKHEHDVLGAIVEWFHANETCFDAPKKEVTTILAANEKTIGHKREWSRLARKGGILSPEVDRFQSRC